MRFGKHNPVVSIMAKAILINSYVDRATIKYQVQDNSGLIQNCDELNVYKLIR